MQQIKLVQQTEIDRKSWDKTINQATNSRIYATSWYLDQLNLKWFGLVYGDYEYCMPLFISKKYGLKYIYQPTYAQQHGIFPNPEAQVTKLFIDKLTQLASYMIIAFNSENKLIEKKFILQKKPNYILSLKAPYDIIHEKYSRSHKRYINQAHKNVTISNISVEQYVTFKVKNSATPLNKNTIETLRKIIKNAEDRGLCNILGAFSIDKNLTAGSIFLNAGKRILYLNGISNNEGKKLRSMYALMDNIISQNAEKDVLLDFEGSSISGVATFFERFGAEHEYYTIAKRNSIPILKHFMK